MRNLLNQFRLHEINLGRNKLLPTTCCSVLLGLSLIISATQHTVHAEEFTNFLGIKLIDIPAGSYKMGSCKETIKMRQMNKKRKFLGLPLEAMDCKLENRYVNDNETPIHDVNIAAFRIGATQVTLGQYKKYLAAIGAEDAESGWNLINEEFKRLNNFGDDAPVVQVSWNEAREFIDWLNEHKPLTDRHHYRFVSEAEWEYTCHAGERHTYCGSNSLNDVGWVDLNENSSQQAVASKAPNAWGVYDMTGNIWEWVGDIYHEDYTDAPTDGSAWTAHTAASKKAHEAKLLLQQTESSNTQPMAMRVSSKFTDAQAKYDRENTGEAWQRDTGTSRVLRGGSWRFGTEMALSTYRLSGEPGNWYYGNGFRIAATIK